jgi:hypothetical protein
MYSVGFTVCIWIYVSQMVSVKKGKGVPQQARCGPECSRRFSFPAFNDIRHVNVVRLSASRTGRVYPQGSSWYLFSLGAKSTQGPWYCRKKVSLKNPVTPPGIVRLVAQRLNHYATPGTYMDSIGTQNFQPAKSWIPCLILLLQSLIT